jgi:hypothetical protein
LTIAACAARALSRHQEFARRPEVDEAADLDAGRAIALR